MRVALDEHHTEQVIRGKEGAAPGRIVRGLREAGVRNPAFILELLDEVKPEVAGALLDVLDPVVGSAFQDQYLQLRFDLSAALWIMTAADPKAIPKQMRGRLEVIELPGYTEQEKLAIAEQYLLKRPFEVTVPVPAGCLAPEPAASPSIVAPDAGSDGPVVVAEREVSSMAELEALSAGPPFPAADAWWTAASEGTVRFESEAILDVIRNTNEAGVAELNAKLAMVCQQVMKRGSPGDAESEVITPAAVREMLGTGAADALPPAVREAIARERRRLGDKPDGDAERTNGWIEWLEQLPWTRSNTTPTDLTSVRAALDAGHAGLEHAKARILEHLAVRRRNPLGTGAVICFSGPPGVGKTSLAQCTAHALGRGFVKLACDGLHDETDLRGHNRTWRDAQPGSILREMRRVGSNDPVFVLDEIDKLGPAPAAVLLEVLDPAQNDRFRDAFVELPFDLSAVLFITTANEVARIPPALRDRLEIIDLPGYTEAEKIAIAETHLIPAQNPGAGLMATPVRFTRGACRRMIRDYTSERGIRQLTRCLQTVCRKVALGLETGNALLVRERITAAQSRPSPRTGRRARDAGRRAGAGAGGPRAAGHVAADRSRTCAGARVPAVPGEPAVDQALRRAARSRARQDGPRRGACRTRSGEGAPRRLHRRALDEAACDGAAALPGGAGGSGQDVAGAAACRGPRARPRMGGLRRAQRCGGGARHPFGPAGADRRRVAACRRPQSDVRPRRGRPSRRRERRGGGAARGHRPGAGVRRSVTAMSTCRSTWPRRSSWPRPTASVRCRRCCGKR